MFTSVIALFTALVSSSVVLSQDIPIVEELIVEKYLGRWFQTHASPIVYATYEANTTCSTANYAVYDEDTLTIYNHANLYSPGGPVSDIRGFAYFTNETGKLRINFPELGDEAFGNYWVMRLGPAIWGEYEQYAYSLVTEPTKLQLFVLARDIDDFYENYEEEVLQFLDDNGFNEDFPNNSPIPTEHTDECEYAAAPLKVM